MTPLSRWWKRGRAPQMPEEEPTKTPPLSVSTPDPTPQIEQMRRQRADLEKEAARYAEMVAAVARSIRGGAPNGS